MHGERREERRKKKEERGNYSRFGCKANEARFAKTVIKKTNVFVEVVCATVIGGKFLPTRSGHTSSALLQKVKRMGVSGSDVNRVKG
jgi:hypothetical protein